MKKIALFGCTADPFTVAHYVIVKGVLDCCPEIDELVIIPTVVNWHREGKEPLLSDSEKIAVTNDFIHSSERIALDSEELVLREELGPNHPDIMNRGFIDTLNRVRSMYGEDNEYFIVLGTDSYRNIRTWRRFDELIKVPNVKFIVVQGRDNTVHHDKELDAKIYKSFKIPEKYQNISASEIRKSIRTSGLEEYRKWISALKIDADADVYKFRQSHTDDSLLLHTPILDVVKGPEVAKGFSPIQLRASDWVTVIPIREKGNVDEVCMVKQLRYGMMKEMIEFPCGTIDPGESPVRCAQRELEEETGIQVSEKEFAYIGKLPTNPGCFTNYMHYFYVYLGSDYKVGKTKFDEHEKIEQKWIELKDVEDIVDNIPALMVAGWHCFKHVREGGYLYNDKGE